MTALFGLVVTLDISVLLNHFVVEVFAGHGCYGAYCALQGINQEGRMLFLYALLAVEEPVNVDVLFLVAKVESEEEFAFEAVIPCALDALEVFFGYVDCLDFYYVVVDGC